MNTETSPSERADGENNNGLAILFDEIDEIEKILEPLNNAESDSLRSQTADLTKRLQSLDDSNVSPLRLSLLRKEISKLKARAGSIANDSAVVIVSFLRNEIEAMEKDLEPLKDPESDSLRSEMEDINKKLGSTTETELPSLQEEIRNIKEKVELLVTRSFLLREIGSIEKVLAPLTDNRFKRGKLNSLAADKEDKKKRLQSADAYELAWLRKDIGKIKEKAVALASSESWSVRLGRVSVLVWLAIIPLLLAIYAGCIAIVQWNGQPRIHNYATQTAQAEPTATIGVTEAPTSTPTPIP